MQCIAIRSYHLPKGKVREYLIIGDIFSNKMEHQHIHQIDLKIGVKINFINLLQTKKAARFTRLKSTGLFFLERSFDSNEISKHKFKRNIN